MIYDDGFNYGYDGYIEQTSPEISPVKVRYKEIRPHYYLHAGCGCLFPISGPWVDGRPTGVIRSGAEPSKVCSKHLRAHYNGIDIRFP